MKKSFLTIAISIALSSTVLSSQVYASESAVEQLNITDNNNSKHDTTETYGYAGIGIGAATGAIVAGPIGLVVGGLIGAIAGSNQETSDQAEIKSQDETVVSDLSEHRDDFSDIIMFSSESIEKSQTDTGGNTYLAQLGSVTPVVENEFNTQQEDIMNILVSDLSLDVYFRSGSTDIEKFYPARLSAIADLVNTMDNLELHLDGYTDRRGDKTQNMALANERIDKVRQQLIDAGVENSRIVSKAFGEAKMKSAAGNLEAYTFDRRVVIRFERLSSRSGTATAALSEIPAAEEVNVTANIESHIPVVADATTRF